MSTRQPTQGEFDGQLFNAEFLVFRVTPPGGSDARNAVEHIPLANRCAVVSGKTP
jgi:hypothetical protein